MVGPQVGSPVKINHVKKSNVHLYGLELVSWRDFLHRDIQPNVWFFSWQKFGFLKFLLPFQRMSMKSFDRLLALDQGDLRVDKLIFNHDSSCR